KAMDAAIQETARRRERQIAYNAEHGINPQTIRKAVGDILDVLRPSEGVTAPGKAERQSRERERVVADLKGLPQHELERFVLTLEDEMNQAASELRFEYAARLRDEIKDLRRELRDAR
ncbi:MAG: UvrB/UvrC motif-containing protein, partial [Ilumatobacteraceae bacterium]